MRRYGKWAGDPNGVLEDLKRCIVGVWGRDSWVPHQCRRKRGYGENGLYCKQHAKRKEKQNGKER